MTAPTDYTALDTWIDQHFDEEVRFLQALVRVPTDTPPGTNSCPMVPTESPSMLARSSRYSASSPRTLP